MSIQTIQPRKVLVFTGNRAEYSILYSVIESLSKSKQLQCSLMVAAGHLDPHACYSMEEIQKDGFCVSSRVPIDNPCQSGGTSFSIGQAILAISKELQRVKPDLFLICADRFESFAAMLASTQMNIPTAHIEGGDLTEGGALDDTVRHAMSKLAHLHFTTNEDAYKRVLSLGEENWRVYNTGYPIIDLIKKKCFAHPEEIKKRFALSEEKKLVIFTQHPITTEYQNAYGQIQVSLKALEQLIQENVQILMTYPNNDMGAEKIIKALHAFSEKHPQSIQLHKNLGRYSYHGILNFIAQKSGGACIGNSSSGIKETPAFGCPTINIGSRQEGRMRACNVLDVPYDEKEILKAFKTCTSDAQFLKQCQNCSNPYGKGHSGKKIAEILSQIPLNQKLLNKKMMV